MPDARSHAWAPTCDNDRVICVHCECSPMSAEAKEPCSVVMLVEHMGTLKEFHQAMTRLREKRAV